MFVYAPNLFDRNEKLRMRKANDQTSTVSEIEDGQSLKYSFQLFDDE